MLRRERKEFTRLTLALPSAAQMESMSNSMRSFPASFPTSTVRRQERSNRRITWISVGGGHGEFPTNLGCGCANLTVLSREHGLLLAGFLVGWIILFLQIIQLGSSWDTRSTRKKDEKGSPSIFLSILLA